MNDPHKYLSYPCARSYCTKFSCRFKNPSGHPPVRGAPGRTPAGKKASISCVGARAGQRTLPLNHPPARPGARRPLRAKKRRNAKGTAVPPFSMVKRAKERGQGKCRTVHVRAGIYLANERGCMDAINIFQTRERGKDVTNSSSYDVMRARGGGGGSEICPLSASECNVCHMCNGYEVEVEVGVQQN